MQNQGESEFARTSVLENCAFFTCVQCGYCGYLILGGSAKELRDEEEGNTRLDRRRKPEGLRAEASGSTEHWRSEVDYGSIYRDCEAAMNALNIVTFWITVISSFLSCAVFTRGRHRNPFNAQS